MKLGTLIDLAAVVGAAQATARVARLLPEGDVVYGTARRITGDTDNVEACSLEVTTDAGLEVSWPLAELADQVWQGEFVVYPS